ncbi:MAG: type II secretion system F family protein [Rubrobacteraceae bacterium]
MSVYNYKVRDPQGEILRDQIEGRDRDSVAESLRGKGLLVIEIREQSPFRRELFDPFKTVRGADLVIFTRQLATMIEAGLPLVRSLGILAAQTESKKLQETIEKVRKDIEGGSSLSEALQRGEDVFGRLYVEMVRAGEVGGALDEVLLRIAAQLEKDQELKRKVRGAMAYPAFVLAFALVAALFMLVFIVPIFAGMYRDLGGNLPLPTRIALGVSDALTGLGGLVFLALICAGAYLFLRWVRTEEGRKFWGRTVLKIPFGIGGVVKKVALARCARTLGALVSSGVPILQALEIAATSSGNSLVENAVLRSREAIRRGSPIHAPLEEETIFPPMVTRMIAVGEETGNLDGMLAKIADFYESEVDNTVKSLTSIIEPVMILIVGAIVGAIIVSMYLPMFRIFELIE